MNLSYCPKCGKLFSKNFREVCNSCHAELEKDYERCAEHLRKNKGMDIQQLSDELEISIKQITKWIREGRISLLDAPNMSYPCESCGVLIREAHLCDSCKKRLQRDVKNANSSGMLQHNPDDDRNRGAYRIGDRLHERGK
ncbi:flagellar protein [Cohnella cholangitidis]|uniref:Flagellar protein n=1 Tax=Cohnella cholangitidis TaxID=2598458 RepID=A0A7G5BXK1_9BACL|nr:flagellar protein [Cohnella cholangitidis]QMV41685.1 flagellar protein [Cohnella cholangitidis]